jgi:heat shock protein HslJ
MRPIALILMAALAVAGCAAQAARDPAPPPVAASSASTTQANLDGTEWRFVEVNGTAVPNGVNATLRLHGSRASGRTGCNAYGASFETGADGSAKFGQAMSTKMACLTPAGAMQVERSVLDALQHTARVERDGDHLTLLDASGKPLAKLVSTTTP